jgi:hypothetical protein
MALNWRAIPWFNVTGNHVSENGHRASHTTRNLLATPHRILIAEDVEIGPQHIPPEIRPFEAMMPARN